MMESKKSVLLYIVIIIFGFFVAQHLNVVVSGSMEPVFYRGDIIVIDSNLNPNDIKIGDIVIYDGKWLDPPVNVVHRVITKEYVNGTLFYKTKGDNNLSPDPMLVNQNQLVAKVVSIYNHPIIIPKIGYITLIIRGL